MSFDKLKRDALYELATENFAVEVSETANKQQIIAALAENGVTWEMAKVFDKNAAAVAEETEAAPQPAPGVITSAQAQMKEVPQPAPVVEEEDKPEPVSVATTQDFLLLKMERENPRYEIRGYKFTQKDPFVLVKSSDADFILTHEEGFKQASPSEAKEYYG